MPYKDPEKRKAYREKIRAKDAQRAREYRKRNKDAIAEKKRERHLIHKEADNERSKQYYTRNAQALRAQKRQYWHDNVEACLERHEAWANLHQSELQAYRKEWRMDNLPKFRGYRIKHEYDLTLVEYEALLSAQNGVCAICSKTPQEGEILTIDHNHETGQVRGLLCRSCNLGLGHFKDSIDLLQNATQYLRLMDTAHGSQESQGEQDFLSRLDYLAQEGHDETGTHPPDCRCSWCEPD